MIITQKLLNVSSQLTTAGLVSQYYKVLTLHIRTESTDKLNDFCKSTRSYVTSNTIQVLKQKATSFLLSITLKPFPPNATTGIRKQNLLQVTTPQHVMHSLAVLVVFKDSAVAHISVNS